MSVTHNNKPREEKKGECNYEYSGQCIFRQHLLSGAEN